MKYPLFLIILFLFFNLANGQTIRENFYNPPEAFHPRPLWFWNNTIVSENEIAFQMQSLRDSCGYGGFGILPFGKKFLPEYLSEDYFKVYRKALETADKLGLKMCLYDEFGFPSGGAGAVNGDDKPRFELKYPEYTIKRLDKTESFVKGPAIFEQDVPPGTLMSVVAMNDQNFTRIDLTNLVKKGKLRWNIPHGDWKVMFFSCVKDISPIVDYLNPIAVKKFISMTHEAYYKHFSEYFGRVISGTFFDEPTMYRADGRMWTESFNREFEKKYHFSPAKLYPALWYDIGVETQSARNYLFGFRSELYAKGFTNQVNKWSVKHGITATGHQDQEEIQNPVSISGDLMKCFKYLEIPGIDKIGGNRPAEKFYKIVSSAACNWDKPYVMSETYGAMGNISFNEMYSVAMDQYAKGINMLIPHAVWYDDHNVTFKPELSHRNKIYRDSLKSFNLFLSRLNVMLQKKGRHIADIALLYPISNLQGEHYFGGSLGYYKGGVEIPDTDYIEIAEWLTNWAGKDYTFLHPEVLDRNCKIEGKEIVLQNKINKENFKILIVPSCKTISLKNLQKIYAFYQQGGKVIFTTQLPCKSAESGQDNKIIEIINTIFRQGEKESINKRGGMAFFLSKPDGSKISEILKRTEICFDVEYSLSENLRYLHKNISGDEIYYFANIGKSPIETILNLRGSLKPEIWDPHNGKIITCPYQEIREEQENKTKIHLSLSPFHSCFIISTN